MRQQQRAPQNIDGILRTVKKPGVWQRVTHGKYRWALAVGTVALLVVVFGIIWQFELRPKDQNNVQVIIKELSRHVILPQNELPILATVTNKTALQTKFLREAENGDKIVIYEKAHRVIIYRPSSDRIVDIGPVELANIPKR